MLTGDFYLKKELSSFTHSFHFLNWFDFIHILEFASSKPATNHSFQSGVMWLISMRRCDTEVFNPLDTHLKHGSWQVYKLPNKMVYFVQVHVCTIYTDLPVNYHTQAQKLANNQDQSTCIKPWLEENYYNCNKDCLVKT